MYIISKDIVVFFELAYLVTAGSPRTGPFNPIPVAAPPTEFAEPQLPATLPELQQGLHRWRVVSLQSKMFASNDFTCEELKTWTLPRFYCNHKLNTEVGERFGKTDYRKIFHCMELSNTQSICLTLKKSQESSNFVKQSHVMCGECRFTPNPKNPHGNFNAWAPVAWATSPWSRSWVCWDGFITRYTQMG